MLSTRKVHTGPQILITKPRSSIVLKLSTSSNKNSCFSFRKVLFFGILVQVFLNFRLGKSICINDSIKIKNCITSKVLHSHFVPKQSEIIKKKQDVTGCEGNCIQEYDLWRIVKPYQQQTDQLSDLDKNE